MRLSKNKNHQYLFFFILSIYTIFNGGNSNLLIQINFIFISFFFIYCLKDKNYYLHFLKFYKNNQISIILYTLFLLYLVFQIIPLPIEFLKFFSPEKYKIINKLNLDTSYQSISLAFSNSFFQILNFTTLLVIVFILKMIFYTNKHKIRLLFFLVLTGAFAASIAVYFYLVGNPDFFIIKNESSKTAATGFFVNRTVYSCFLVLCFLSGMEYLQKIDHYEKNNKNNFFNKIYIRIFILLITIGIITSFSRLGNFLFISVITLYILKEFFNKNKKNRFFLITLLLIVIFDILILGFYFGSDKLIQRYSFLQSEINNYTLSLSEANTFDASRGTMAKFAFSEFKKFIFFGYGLGGFENLFKSNFVNTTTKYSSLYASHAHSDLFEFIGELGLIGSALIILSVKSFCANKKNFLFKNFILLYLLIFIFIFDFSFHIPIVQLLFVILFSINFEKIKKFK